MPFVQTIEQVGYGLITHTGVEHVNMDIEDGELYISGTRGDDVIEFTPLSDDSGALTADHIPTLYLIDDVPAANPLVITGGGTGRGGPSGGGFADKVIYHGTSGADLIRVDAPNRTVGLSVLGFGYPPPGGRRVAVHAAGRRHNVVRRAGRDRGAGSARRRRWRHDPGGGRPPTWAMACMSTWTAVRPAPAMHW